MKNFHFVVISHNLFLFIIAECWKPLSECESGENVPKNNNKIRKRKEKKKRDQISNTKIVHIAIMRYETMLHISQVWCLQIFWQKINNNITYKSVNCTMLHGHLNGPIRYEIMSMHLIEESFKRKYTFICLGV